MQTHRRLLAMALITTLAVAGACGGDSESAPTTQPTPPTPATTPRPGRSTEGLDLCATVGRAAAEDFLGALDAGPVAQEQGDSNDRATVCGWFLAAEGAARPQGLVVRAEVLLPEGNPACVPTGETAVDELPLEGATTSWITLAQNRIDAAATIGSWCLYVRGPLGFTGAPGAAAAATASLLDSAVTSLDGG